MSDPSIPFTKMQARDDVLRDIYDKLMLAFKPNTVCDVGAFNGDETFRFTKLVPDADFFAFEASDWNFKSFWRDAPRWKSLPKVKYENMAVTDYVGNISFNVLDAEETAGDWRRAANSIMPRSDGLGGRKITVPCTTLDAYFENKGLADRTFMLWIDVEGALDRVISGGKKVLSRTIALRAEVEWKELWKGQKLAPELKAMIEAHGFVVVGDAYLPNAYDQSDVLFLRKDVLNLIKP